MKILIKIITFPIVLVIIILAFLLRFIFSFAGSLICFMSGALGVILKLLGAVMTFAAVGLSIYSIHGMVTGSVEMSVGIFTIAAFWIVAFLLDSLWLVGAEIGLGMKDIGEKFTDGALYLLTW